MDNFDKLQGNHIDGNPQNNTLNNLEWVTPKENVKHAYTIGIGNHGKCPTILIHIDSGKSYCFESVHKMHEFVIQHTSIDCSARNIGNLCKGKVIRDGYKFMYADDSQYREKVDTLYTLTGENWELYLIGKLGWKYYVSNLARVKVVYHSGKERIIKHFTRDGYHRISIRGKEYALHRVVADVFVPNPYNRPFIDLVDTDRQNNVPANLRWVTREQNMNNPATIAKLKEGHRRRRELNALDSNYFKDYNQFN